MHAIKFFTCTVNTIAVQRLQNDINEWLKEAKTIYNALVIQRTDMMEANTLFVFSIYYTYLPNEKKTEDAAPAG